MKLVGDNSLQNREYPYIVTLGTGRNTRWLVEVGNEPAAPEYRRAHSFYGPGAVDATDSLTATGRKIILNGVKTTAGGSASTTCVVWAPDECTYVLQDGTVIDGRTPPKGDPIYPEDYAANNADVISVRWVALPKGSEWPFLCIRLLDRNHVEITSGEPLMLGHFDELPIEGPGSELRRHLDENGQLVAPPVFRGVNTTGIANGYTLLGPVQPNGCEVRVVEPWPSTVFAAAEAIAGKKLSKSLLQAIWRAVEPEDPDMNMVGALKAA